MSSKSTMFTTLSALAFTCGAGPTQVHAQGNRGELVSATAKLNQAQMALVKRLADDAGFADQFNAATSKGNAAAVADLVSRRPACPRRRSRSRAALAPQPRPRGMMVCSMSPRSGAPASPCHHVGRNLLRLRSCPRLHFLVTT